MKITLMEKDYLGYDATENIVEDFEECFSPSMNIKAKDIPDNFKGTIRVKVMYIEDNCYKNQEIL